jgi:hypothetical protein
MKNKNPWSRCDGNGVSTSIAKGNSRLLRGSAGRRGSTTEPMPLKDDVDSTIRITWKILHPFNLDFSTSSHRYLYQWQIDLIDRFIMSARRSPCTVSTRKKDANAENLGLVEILVLVGAAVTIIVGFFDVFGSSIGLAFFGALGIGFIWNLIWGIVDIILAIGLVAGLGFLPSIKFKITSRWSWLLVIGIVIFVPTGNWGGILIAVAGIVKAFI